jgi:hypothetical protein
VQRRRGQIPPEFRVVCVPLRTGSTVCVRTRSSRSKTTVCVEHGSHHVTAARAVARRMFRAARSVRKAQLLRMVAPFLFSAE